MVRRGARKFTDIASAEKYRYVGAALVESARALLTVAEEGDRFGNAIGIIAVHAVIAYTDALTISYGGYPNPVSSETRISISAAHPGTYSLSIFDVLGRGIRRENLDLPGGGEHTRSWQGDFSSGIYFVRLSGGGRQITKTVTVAR